jgi:2-polyprenyl-3-methyl-5-hydroxy-6-metoxy-1,4-benzoquinol methylase
MERPVYTEEQQQSLDHFNARSSYWYDIYQDQQSFTGYAYHKQHQTIVDLIAHTEDARCILDVGCGAGVTVLELAHQGYQASGIDIAPNMIQRAQAEARLQDVDCDFRVGVAEVLPYSDHSFDVLIALGLLGNILDDEPVLREMARVLKPGGRLLVTVPNLLALDLLLALPKSLPIMLGSTRLRRPLRTLGNLVRRLTGRKVKPASTLRFNQCVMPGRYVAHLQQYGFRDAHYHAVTFGPLMPFGLRLFGDSTAIAMSERIAHLQKFGLLGTIIVYDARRI